MSDPTYCVIDTETTRKATIGNHDGTPFDPANRIVMRGWKLGNWPSGKPTTSPTAVYFDNARFKEQVAMLVGHHITYDLHYLLKSGEMTKEFLGTVNLWDTQLAEYLLSGQRHTYPSLDELVEKYGGTLKDPTVKAAFEAGKGADEIDPDVLEKYLKEDVLNTERVFHAQVKRALEMDMLPLIQTQMDALLATTEMTYNGLKVDDEELLKGTVLLRAEVDKLEARLKYIAGAHPGFGIDFNVGSTKQLSNLLFGGEEKYEVSMPVGIYKNGKTKFKKQEQVRKLRGMGLTPTGPKNGKGDYPTDDKALTELLAKGLATVPRDFVEALIEWREKDKQLGTYWEAMMKLRMPDGCIHHSLNHCVTRTGRLSSSDPNLQNVTNGDIKGVFVSRFGKDGVIIEADYSQLEMVELAIISGCRWLTQDIKDGVDMHNALFETMYGRRMKKEERKKFKRCSFALVYGGGPGAVSAQGGIDKDDAKRFIDTFYARYKGVQEYHENIVMLAKAMRKHTGLKDTATGKPVGEFTYTSEHSKRRYWFREYEAPEWMQKKGIEFSFSPTELKNYMVQGGATGDKVPLAVGQLYRVLRNHPRLKDKCLMVNTVHDSIMFDCHKDVLDEALAVIKAQMEALPDAYEAAFGYRMPLPLKVGLSYGPTWLDQTEVEFDPLSHEWRKAA